MAKNIKRRRKPLQRMPRVAILLESAYEHSLGLLRGIMKYVRLYGPWGLHIISGGKGDQRLPLVEQWKATGIIARVPNEKVARTIVSANLPTVLFDPLAPFLAPKHPLSRCCRCFCDNRRIGQLAAEHFLEQKFEHFAFVPNLLQTNWATERFEAFREHLAQFDKKVTVYPIPSEAECDWGIEFKRIIPWLRRLPKPAAVFTPDDLRGRQVLDACLIANIKVPYQLAVLGVANDREVCETTTPPLSSIAVDTEAAGFAAAEMLDGLMRGTFSEQREFIYHAKEVVRRGSAEAVSFDDPLILQALEFIHINSGFSIRVTDVAKHLKLSRRTVEMRFKSILGHSVLEEIHKVRIESIRKLVAHTATPFGRIAVLSGLESATHLGEIFKAEFGMTMSEYREQKSGDFYQYMVATGPLQSTD